MWQEWIGLEAADMLRLHGYYAAEVKGHKNLKIIALNTLSCSIKNFFLIDNPTDPGQQLAFVREELTKSEKLG